jgi:uncharacterized integral membrane protein
METADEQRAGRRIAVSVGVIVGLVVAAGVAALIGQNTSDVTVRWLMLDGQQPLWIVLPLTALAGVVMAKMVGIIWRHRERD